MKTILVATDNSTLANNALNYAVALALDINAKIILVTSFEMVISSSYDVAFVAPTSLDVENSIKESHEKTIEKVKAMHPSVFIESLILQGSSTDVIINEALTRNVELVVMGLKEIGSLGRILLGSTVRSVIHENKVPVLAIPEKATYKGIKRTAFAFDYTRIKNNKMENFIHLLTDFKSKLLIVNVVNKLSDIDTNKATIGLNLNNLLYDVEHTYHYPADEHISRKIIDFCKEFEVDCLAIVPHHHSLMDTLFTKSTTDEIMNEISIPLLTIPD